MFTPQIARPQTPTTLIGALIPHAQAPSLLTDILLIGVFANVVAVCAQIAIPLPFTPVPITGQTFAVLLSGAVLGPRRAFLAMLLYLLEGGAGLPVFAVGALGWAKFAGPTGGYLLSYPFAAAFVGGLAERGWDRQSRRAFPAMLMGSGIIFAFGMLWLSRFVGGIIPAFVKGVLPFLPGDALKAALASCALPASWAILRRSEREARKEEV